MAIIDDIIDSVGRAGKFAYDKTIDAKDYVTLEYKLSKLKTETDKCFIELGKLCYDNKEDGKAQLIEKISVLKLRENELLNEMSKFKKTCSACGKRACANDAFCKNCGNKL